MKKRALALVAFVLAGLGAAAGRSRSIGGGSSGGGGGGGWAPAPPDPELESGDPDAYWFGPGWFWAFVDWQTDAALFDELQRRERGNLIVRKVLSYPGNRYAALVFEVTIDPVEWPRALKGRPMPAPRAGDTELTDLETAPPPEADNVFFSWLGDMLQQPIDSVRTWDRELQEWLDSKLRGTQ